MHRRALLLLPLAAALPARAQAWPEKPVRMIVPFPPGQAADIFARIVADQLSARWPQRVFVENRAGGAGAIGLEAGARAAPDGYTLTIGTSGTLGINPSVVANLPYDPLKDFAPVSNIFQVPLLLVCHPAQPWRTPAELVAAAKATPGAINYGSAGPGIAQHLTAEMFAHATGIRLQHVPYRGSAPAMTDLIAGTIPLMMDSLAAALPHVRDGRARALAITSARRSPLLPDVPTLAETVAPGFEAAGWSGVIAPAATPRPLVERISADIRAVLADPAVRARIEEQGGIPDPGTPEQFGAFIEAEILKWRRVAEAAGVRL
jgi:tripartite-type tricarboxylate transporter receptor subunit TctC